MPKLRSKLHNWWLEWVFSWNIDVDDEGAPFVRGVWRARKFGFEVSDVVGAGNVNVDARAAVIFNVLKLLGDTAHAVAVARHSDSWFFRFLGV